MTETKFVPNSALLNESWGFTMVPRGADYRLGMKAHKQLRQVTSVGDLRNILDAKRYGFSKGHYFLFRDGVRPLFEAPENSTGGEWIFTFANLEDLKQGWISLVCGAAGESLFKSRKLQEDICGVQLVYNKLAVRLWTRTKPEQLLWDPSLVADDFLSKTLLPIAWATHF